MKLLAVLTFLLALSGIFVLAHSRKGAEDSIKGAPAATITAIVPQQGLHAVDGSINPELVPDRIAYSLLFRLIAGHKSDTEKERIRAYLRQAGFNAGDSEILITAAQKFSRTVSVFDDQAKQIKHGAGLASGPSVRNGLKQLRGQADAAVDETVISLRSRLSTAVVTTLNHHIQETVKRRIKLGVSDSSF